MVSRTPTLRPKVGDIVAVRGEVVAFDPKGAPEGADCWHVLMPNGTSVSVYEGEDALAPWPKEVPG
jgi:hypothetical protein